jgi:hypothetical protein
MSDMVLNSSAFCMQCVEELKPVKLRSKDVFGRNFSGSGSPWSRTVAILFIRAIFLSLAKIN